jgi:hypothetical protein
MARYEHLPIYKKAMDDAVHFEKVVAGFSRYHKYTLGTDLRNKSREIVSMIAQVNSTRENFRQSWAMRIVGKTLLFPSFLPIRYQSAGL